ncbi:MAG: hypothetical protein ACTHMO_02580 [Rhodanobacteraceae bacterium]
MYRIRAAVVLAVTLGVLAACGTSSDLEQRTTGLQLKITELQDQLNTLKGQVDSQQKANVNLSNAVFRMALKDHSSASFDPVTGQGYELLDVGIVRVMVSIENITPYADGVKVVMNIGNPNAVTLSGLDGEAQYGPSSAGIQNNDYAAWEKLQKKVHLSIPDRIYPGRWNSVTVTLPGIKPEQFGRLEISLSGNQVELSK